MAVIKISDKEYGLKFNLRAAKVYQELTGEDITQMSGVSGIGEFIYACIVAHCKSEKVEVSVTLDDVYDGLDIQTASAAIQSLLPEKQGE